MAVAILVSRFSTDTRDTPRGVTKLTEVSVAIGRAILSDMTDEKMSSVKHIHVGDCFLGALFEAGYIDIYRDPAYSDFAEGAPYIVEANMYFSELGEIPPEFNRDLLTATQGTEIAPITQLLQGHNRPLIKGFYNLTDDSQKRLLDYLRASITNKDPWITAINKLQQTAWKINGPVYEIVEREFSKMIQPVPPRPGIGSAKAVKEALEALRKDGSDANKDKFNREVKLWNKELETLIPASKNVECSIVKAKAEALKDMDRFYQYVEADYRGRLYIQEPFLNYQGNDIARGVLMFAEGKPLGISGYRWLAIHTACCYNEVFHKDEMPEWITSDYKELLDSQGLDSISVDKMTQKDKELWTWNNMDKVVADATSLQDCEKPVLYLACCIEWVKAHEVGLSDDYICHLPIPIDGSCNGYQHSAAIAKDEVTGALVSLIPQDIQADLYVVAAKELIARNQAFFDARPDLTMKDVRKYIAKRATMTRAYSAGKEKISDNMYKDCHQGGLTDDYDITMVDCMDLGSSMYDLIKDICPGATRTMTFLQNLASYELGTFKQYDPNNKVITKSKRTRLRQKVKKLRKIEDPTEEQLQDLNDTAAYLESLEFRCIEGNGARFMAWVTPSKFPVIYEDFIMRTFDVKSTIPGFGGGATGQPGRITHVLQEPTERPDVSSFQAGISPNVIHSLDAAHMASVINSWDGAFVGVHDSFSTHACDVDKLSMETREKFVDMYDVDDPYAALAEMILSPCVYDEELPDIGNLDIEEVKKSPYFFC